MRTEEIIWLKEILEKIETKHQSTQERLRRFSKENHITTSLKKGTIQMNTFTLPAEKLILVVT